MREVSKYTIKELRELCQATAGNPKMETRIGRFARIFSIYLTRFVLSHSLFDRISPPMIVATGSLVYFAGAFTYFGPYHITLFGPFIYFLSIVIDGTDGEVARFRGQADKWGGRYAEPVSHDFQDGFFFFLISLALYFHGAPPVIVIFGALTSITKLLYRLLRSRFWEAFYAGTARVTQEEQIRAHEVRKPFIRFLYTLNKNIFTYPAIVGPLLIATVLDRMDIFVYFYAAGSVALLAALFTKQMYLRIASQK